MAWGWRGGNNPAGSSPTERSRVPWLEEHGITPMNRSTRMWDMEIVPPRWVFWHRIERVGSLDRAKRALDLQRGGVDFAPIKWQGSQSMATGRAYDWCYCIEAVSSPEVDGRTACKCQCADCKEGDHWRKRNHASRLRAQMVRHINQNRYGWRGFSRRWAGRWARWREFWQDVQDEGLWHTLLQSDVTIEIEQDTPQEPYEWYGPNQRDPEE